MGTSGRGVGGPDRGAQSKSAAGHADRDASGFCGSKDGTLKACSPPDPAQKLCKTGVNLTCSPLLAHNDGCPEGA
jgi:hypothetical protein